MGAGPVSLRFRLGQSADPLCSPTAVDRRLESDRKGRRLRQAGLTLPAPGPAVAPARLDEAPSPHTVPLDYPPHGDRGRIRPRHRFVGSRPPPRPHG